MREKCIHSVSFCRWQASVQKGANYAINNFILLQYNSLLKTGKYRTKCFRVRQCKRGRRTVIGIFGHSFFFFRRKSKRILMADKIWCGSEVGRLDGTNIPCFYLKSPFNVSLMKNGKKKNHSRLAWPLANWGMIYHRFWMELWDQFTFPNKRLLPDKTEEISSLSTIPIQFQWNLVDSVTRVTSARLACEAWFLLFKRIVQSCKRLRWTWAIIYSIILFSRVQTNKRMRIKHSNYTFSVVIWVNWTESMNYDAPLMYARELVWPCGVCGWRLDGYEAMWHLKLSPHI